MTDEEREQLPTLLEELRGLESDDYVMLDSRQAGLLVELLDECHATLRPFADCAEQLAPEVPDQEWAKFRLLAKHYRAARLAYLTTAGQASGF